MICSTARAAIPAIAQAVVDAIPVDTNNPEAIAALFDMAQAFADPTEWVLLHGDDMARWALEKAVEATADYTIDGWEDDAARLAFNHFNDLDNA